MLTITLARRLPSVRLLLPLVALAVGLVSGCGEPASPQQQAAMSKYQSLGGRFLFAGGGYRLELSGTPIANDDLALLKDIPKLTGVDLRDTRFNDEGLKHLEAVKSLIYIDLTRSNVSRDGYERLQKTFPNAEIRI